MRKLVIGMSGATGAVFAVRLLEALADTEVETHLIVSKWARYTLEHETTTSFKELRALASQTYGSDDMSAKVSSGSFHTDGMVVVPCSMRTVAAIAHSNGDHLVHRAADVILKERRKLVLVARETPLNDFHLENLLKLSRIGVTILPPMPAFYNKPETLNDMVDHIVMRILDQFDIATELAARWDGVMKHQSRQVKAVKTNHL